MHYMNIMVLVIGLSAGIYKTTHAETISKNSTNNVNNTVIVLKKDTVQEASKIAIANNSLKVNIAATKNSTTEPPSLIKKVLAEGVVVNKTVPSTNINSTKEVAKGDTEEKVTTESTNSNNNKADTTAISKNDKQILKQQDKNNATTNLIISSTTTPPVPSTTTKTNSTPPTTASSTSSTNVSTSSTTSTTTTTTTPKPKKPTITFGVQDFPDLEKNSPEIKNLPQSSSSGKLPITPDAPYAQPSQEFNNNFHQGRDYILPIVSMLFIIPLVIGILITSYRRFRDCWSTRHYRRMDFLVDGMYND